MLTLNIIFFFLNHPIRIGIMLIIQTLIIRVYSGILIKTFWISYLLTITIISGILVLFIYISRIASNEKFKTSTKIWTFFIRILSIITLSLFLLKKIIIKNNYLGIGIRTLKIGEIYFLNKIFIGSNLFITIILVVYLLLTIIVSSFLVNISEGPIRLKI